MGKAFEENEFTHNLGLDRIAAIPFRFLRFLQTDLKQEKKESRDIPRLYILITAKWSANAFNRSQIRQPAAIQSA
jgi:hypothetical protein